MHHRPRLRQGRRTEGQQAVGLQVLHQTRGPGVGVKQVLGGARLGHAVLIEARRPLGRSSLYISEKTKRRILIGKLGETFLISSPTLRHF